MSQSWKYKMTELKSRAEGWWWWYEAILLVTGTELNDILQSPNYCPQLHEWSVLLTEIPFLPPDWLKYKVFNKLLGREEAGNWPAGGGWRGQCNEDFQKEFLKLLFRRVLLPSVENNKESFLTETIVTQLRTMFRVVWSGSFSCTVQFMPSIIPVNKTNGLPDLFTLEGGNLHCGDSLQLRVRIVFPLPREIGLSLTSSNFSKQ